MCDQYEREPVTERPEVIRVPLTGETVSTLNPNHIFLAMGPLLSRGLVVVHVEGASLDGEGFRPNWGVTPGSVPAWGAYVTARCADNPTKPLGQLAV